ncbi:TetR/AcrR family transcriptional regulator [Leucobacter sp. HY1908]
MRNSLLDVVAAALRVLEAQGLEGCSMRRVAAELGVQPSALYHHVPDKQTLLALMADEIVAGVGHGLGLGFGAADAADAAEPAAPALPHASAAAEQICAEMRRAMLVVRDGADVVSTAAAFRLGASRVEEDLTGLVGRDGARTLLLYTFGQAQATQMHQYAAEHGALVSNMQGGCLGVGGAGDAAGDAREDHEASFARGLDIILAGLAATGASAGEGV